MNSTSVTAQLVGPYNGRQYECERAVHDPHTHPFNN